MKIYKIVFLLAISLISFPSFCQSLTNKTIEELETMKKEAITSENYDLANKISEEQKSRVSLDDKLIELDKNLKIAVANENFDEAEKIKKEIKSIEEKKVTIKKLEEEKKAAILIEDFDKVLALEKQINELKSCKPHEEKKPLPPAPVQSPVNTSTPPQTFTQPNNPIEALSLGSKMLSQGTSPSKGLVSNQPIKKAGSGGAVGAVIVIGIVLIALLILL